MKTITNILMQLTMMMVAITPLESQELTLYVLPSPIDRKWESPRELILTTIKNVIYPEKYKKHILGHVVVYLKNGDESYITGSVAAKDIDLKSMVVMSGQGLGILNTNIRGRLEKKEELSHELAMRYKYGNISFIRFRISDEMFDRLVYYLREYDARDYDTIYNGLNKPREGKGAGCSAFAVSFLEVAGILQGEWIKNWQKKVRIPIELVGSPKQNVKVRVMKIIRDFDWARKEEPHVETSFYDPNAMHKWILEQSNQGTTEAIVVRNNKAVGIEYDFSQMELPHEAVFPDSITMQGPNN